MNTKEKIEVMQAYEEGKTVFCQAVPGYAGHVTAYIKGKTDDENDQPAWNWENYRYWVKREPRVYWKIEYPDGNLSYPEYAERPSCGRGRPVKFVEDMSDAESNP